MSSIFKLCLGITMKIWPKAYYCAESTSASKQLFNFMEVFIFKWKSWGELPHSLAGSLPSEALLGTSTGSGEALSLQRESMAQCRVLSAHRDRFLSACFQKQFAVESVCTRLEVQGSLLQLLLRGLMARLCWGRARSQGSDIAQKFISSPDPPCSCCVSLIKTLQNGN